MIWRTSGFIAVAFLLIYGYQCWSGDRDFALNELFVLFLYAPGIAGGALLVLTTLFPSVPIDLGPSIDFYVIIGGLTVLAWCSLNAYSDLEVDHDG